MSINAVAYLKNFIHTALADVDDEIIVQEDDFSYAEKVLNEEIKKIEKIKKRILIELDDLKKQLKFADEKIAELKGVIK